MSIRSRIIALLLAALLAAAAIPALADYGAVAAKSTRLYAFSNRTGAVGTLPKYTAVVVRSKRSGTACIRYGGKTYYVAAKALTDPWKTTVSKLHAKGIDDLWDLNRYTRKSCYVYDYPSTHANRRKIKKNVDMDACWVKNGWTLVVRNGYFGYIKSKYLGMRKM